MTQLITAKLDLAKIHGAVVRKKDGRTFIEVTNSQLFEGQNGAPYLDVALFPSTNDKFGNDYRVNQDLARPLRDAGHKGAILGNAKIKTIGGGSPAPRPAPAPQQDGNDDEIPPF